MCTSRKIPATPLMTIQKIMNGYHPTQHQSCNRSNIVRNFYCLLVTTELAPGSKKDTAINRVHGDDKTFAISLFSHGIFNNYLTCHTRTWITSTLRLLNEQSPIQASMVGVSNSFRSYPSRPIFILVSICSLAIC